MNIKKQTVIPPDVKVTRLPASDGKARSVYSLEKQQERALAKQAEQERQQKRFKHAFEVLKMSVAEAALYAMK
jgi:DNA-binding PadR family transcriptional regulator